jgi:hypothetical protein
VKTTMAQGRLSPEPHTTASNARPPRLVILAIAMVAGQYAIALVRVCLMKHRSPGAGPVIFGLILISAICLPWMYGLWRRRNWVRWLTVILGATGCALASRSVARLHDPTQVILYWLQFALTIPVVIILVLPPVGAWYKSRPKPLPRE